MTEACEPTGMTDLDAIGITTRPGGYVTVSGPEGIDATYRVPPRPRRRTAGPPRAVLLDLDGTSLCSERFWVDVLEETARTVSGRAVRFTAGERVRLQGASTRAHLAYVIRRHRLDASLATMIRVYERTVADRYFGHAVPELSAQFSLARGFAEVRRSTRELGLPFIIVTNGTEDKARVGLRIIAHHLGLSDVADVCDGVWCAPGRSGTLRGFGTSAGKPHPWPYVEAAVKGAGVPAEHLSQVLAVDDSAAGVCSIRLAGMRCVGVEGGNITATGAGVFCDHLVGSLAEVPALLAC